MKAYLFIVAVLCFLSCTSKDRLPTDLENIQKNDSLTSNDTTVTKCTALVETILNFPDLIKFSKLDLVKEEHNKVYVDVKGCVNKSKSFVQNGVALDVLKADSTAEALPVYLFQKFEIRNDSAYVIVLFTYTNATAIGSLKFKNDRWVPDPNFLIGVR